MKEQTRKPASLLLIRCGLVEAIDPSTGFGNCPYDNKSCSGSLYYCRNRAHADVDLNPKIIAAYREIIAQQANEDPNELHTS